MKNNLHKIISNLACVIFFCNTVHPSHEASFLLDIPEPRDILGNVFSFLTAKEIMNISTAFVFNDSSEKKRNFKVAFFDAAKEVSAEMDIALKFEGNKYDFQTIERAAKTFPYCRGFISTTQILILDILEEVDLSYLSQFRDIKELHIKKSGYFPDANISVSIFRYILRQENLQKSVQALDLAGSIYLDEAEASILSNFNNLKKLHTDCFISQAGVRQLQQNSPNLHCRSMVMAMA